MGLKSPTDAEMLLELVKRDVNTLSDEDLERLMLETNMESSRRNKLLNTNGSFLKSRWLASFLLLGVAFFILFKAETNSVHEEPKLAAPGEKGAWLLGDTTTEKKESDQSTTAGAEITSPELTVEEGGIEEPPSYDQRPRATINAKLVAKKDGTRPKVIYQYKTRSPVDTNPAKAGERDKIRADLASKWGSWTLVDPKAAERPKDDFAKSFPDRDIPWDKFPSNAWQVDKDYLSKFLPEAKAHVERAMEAILAEYGWSKFDLPDLSLEERINGTELEPHSFNTAVLNLTVDSVRIGKKNAGEDFGGWLNKAYLDGLMRRVMHAIITGDTFTLVMGGHSAAAGHGNHFQQSYTLQFHKVMEPVFARLGVKLQSHNVAFGGLGTLQTSLGSGDLYGKEIDIMVWDSGMTENSDEAYDFYARQAILAGNRIPVLNGGTANVLTYLGKNLDFPVAQFGSGTGGVPEITDGTMAESVKWMARYLRCSGETHVLCREREYNGTCWIERDDYTPTKDQQNEPGGRASWHPGFRVSYLYKSFFTLCMCPTVTNCFSSVLVYFQQQHAIKGRTIAFPVLMALHEGLKMWDEAPDKKLPVDMWHVSDHYKSLRTKLQEIPKEDVPCFRWKELEPKDILCTTAIHVRVGRTLSRCR
jgi:hypothetical protein